MHLIPDESHRLYWVKPVLGSQLLLRVVIDQPNQRDAVPESDDKRSAQGFD